MGFVVLVMCSPILIPLVIILLVLGLKGDEWFGHGDPRRKGQYVYIHNEEGEIVDIFKDKAGTVEPTICFDDDDNDDEDLFDEDYDDDDWLDDEEDEDDWDDDDYIHDTGESFNRFQDGTCSKSDIEQLMEDDDIRDEFYEDY